MYQEDNISDKTEFTAYRYHDKKVEQLNDVMDFLNDVPKLTLLPYQEIVGNFMGPDSTYDRLMLKWAPGVGKTLGVINIAMEFIKVQKLSPEPKSVFVLGFSESIFRTELMRFPEFGFITPDELRDIRWIRTHQLTPELQKKKTQIESLVKRRMTNGKNNGLFKFIGYQALVSKLFRVAPGADLKIKASKSVDPDPESIGGSGATGFRGGATGGRLDIDKLDPELLIKYLESGKILVNEEFLKSVDGSLIISDEVHITNNTQRENNWGFSILYILRHVKCKFVGLSGTPFNNNPAEVVFILNLLGHDLKRTDLFKFESGRWKLLPGSLEKIAELSKGRFSFIQDMSGRFPAKKFIGQPLPGTPYLKFIRCSMSEFYQKNYLEVEKQSKSDAIEQENQNIMDFCLPGPNGKGVFASHDIAKLEFEKKDYRQKYGIEVKNGVIRGAICDSDSLKKYAPKYYRMISDVLEFIKEPQKMLIYHKNIRNSGVLFIEEILIRHGFTAEDAIPSQDALCYYCQKPASKHSKTGGADSTDKFESRFPSLRFNNISFFDGGMMNRIVDPEMKSELKKFEKLAGDEPVILETESPELVKTLNKFGFEILEGGSESGIGGTSSRSKVRLIKNVIPEAANELFDVGYTNIDNYLQDMEDPEIKAGFRDLKTRTKSACGGGKCPEFLPIRYVLMHGDMDKNKLTAAMERYNAVSNKLGKHIMIAVGSKKIGQGYNFTAIRKLMVMNRPDNISALKQIIGRGARNMSHADLNPDQQNVNIYLYVNSFAEKGKWTYDERKYMEKVQDYLVIQKIEQVIHENTIDPFIIKSSESSDFDPNFDMLPYTKEIPSQAKIRANKLHYSSFDAYYSRSVINQMIYLIKRLFIEVSPIFTYEDLYRMVVDPPDLTGISYFDFGAAHEDLFLVAIDIILTSESHGGELLLSDPTQKIITNGRFRGIIAKKGVYYCLIQIDEKNNEILHPDSFFRLLKSETTTFIELSSVMKNLDSLYDYDDRKEVFYNKWTGINVMEMESALCDNNTEFHKKFIEEIIEYIFGLITKKKKRSKYHEFYFKMIFYYNIRDIIIWPHTARDFVSNMYSKYFKDPEHEFIADTKSAITELTGHDISTGNLINILKTSFNNSIIQWYPDEAQAFYKKLLNNTLAVYENIIEKAFRRIPSNMLPIGYCVNDVPRFYHPDKGWFDIPDYFETSNYIENDIIIGYDVRVDGAIQNRFKLRNPVHLIKKFKDRRKIETGSICSASKSKTFIFSLLKKLKIDYEPSQNVVSLCSLIRTKLILNELTERQKKSKIKWFYSAWERQGG